MKLSPASPCVPVLAALLVAAISAPAQTGGLDPSTQARFDAATETIRRANADRKSAFLAYGTPTADRYMALQEFRDRRRKAVLAAADALLEVRGSFPKDSWKALVERLGAGGPMPLLVDQALKELPSVIPDAARRAPAEKAFTDLANAIRKDEKERESARKKFFSLLEKATSTRDDFISRLESFNDTEEKLDQKIAEGAGAAQAAMSRTDWDELVRRISPAR
jgi:hypothetical protein